MRSAGSPSATRCARWLAGLLVGAALAATGCATQARSEPHPSLERLWRSYQALPAERALAVAGDPRRQWVAGLVGGEPTIDEAEQVALERCRQNRAARRLQAPCRTYAVGDEIVWRDW
jgi:hypothetical protein